MKGEGLVRVEKDDDPKNRKGVIALPDFAVEMLKGRKVALAARRLKSPPDPKAKVLNLVFPSAMWTLRDPQNVGHEWQRVRDALGILDDVTAHSFRGAVATILDDAGLSARVTADVLMHVDPAMTQRRYMARKGAQGCRRCTGARRQWRALTWTWTELVGTLLEVRASGVDIIDSQIRLYQGEWSRLGESNPRPFHYE